MNDDVADSVRSLLPRLREGRVRCFPVRHHSPACADHLNRWIRLHKPAAILIEGPSSFTPLIELLLEPDCVCPVAIFTTFVEKENDRRSSAYYPFCDYSPEWNALRTGHEIGARLSFIDLDYADQIVARHGDSEEKPEGVRIESLFDDDRVGYSEYVKTLSRRLGCRDADETWDHLFETLRDSRDTEGFIDRVAIHCLMARLGYTREELAKDGTLAREACMAAAIREEQVRTPEGLILVVTGGFHTVVLPDLLKEDAPAPKAAKPAGETGTWLVRYSFDQLDALSGYGAGMPQPAYYDRLWRTTPETRRRETAEIVTELGQLTRQRNMTPVVSTPDVIAAVQQANELARFRNHPWPSRDDLLDGMKSCFVKGEIGIEGAPLVALMREVLGGNRIGRVPAAAGLPPIVAHFQGEAKRLKLPVDAVEKREVALDLYRDARHREISRFLHRLDLLGCPFAQYVAGPDFVGGHGLDLMIEHWSVRWSPAVESSLIEAAPLGTTLLEAAGNKLRMLIEAQENAGAGRGTGEAVAMLVRACRLGLHRQSQEMLATIARYAAEDAQFDSLAEGLSQLQMLRKSLEPLEANRLTAIPGLEVQIYQRVCYLAGDLPGCADDAVSPAVRHLKSLNEIRRANVAMDGELLDGAFEKILATPADRGQAAILGAVAGICFGNGALDETELRRRIDGYLGGTQTDPRRSAGFLRGLLTTCREIAWQVEGFLQSVDGRLLAWDDDEFARVLPELRLAFAELSPRETSDVADCVARMTGEAMDDLVHTDAGEDDVMLGLELNRRLKETLIRDGLAGRA